ncbi:extracellular solute-binding protein [Leptothoe kymatousa]|uniref:Extracellular solute-binding protein n=1 Tax=Leptothoe kymatousa TAU-MAC 1615 TaxID=2364775 RepID=A0ABS5Y619_9CYAN|nr:extracellular solute-binding protein [Leptothoe kymatousa]MBT9313287.1 extracellular solute-binding protein [Leptothoe kymatousa TAU-MAC 1615]
MVKRRTVLWGCLGLAIASCRPQTSFPLRIKFLARSLPSRVLKVFDQTTPTQFEASTSLLDIYRQLQWWQSRKAPLPPLWRRWFPAAPAEAVADTYRVDTNLVTLGDPWLDHAIRQKLIQPLSEFAPLESLPEPWQRLLRRDRQGQSTAKGDLLWAVPYRTQGLMIAYQKSFFQRTKPIHKWADLWRPELAGRIAMPNHPRLAMAIALKALGYSANDEAALVQDDVKEQLLALYRQVRVFDSQAHLKALVNEDVWLTVGWSDDVLETLVRYRRLGAVYPEEGTVLTSDLWVSPINADLTEDAQAWLKFCWQPDIATQISIASKGSLSPLFFSPGVSAPEQLPEAMATLPQDGEVLLPLLPALQTELVNFISDDAHP